MSEKITFIGFGEAASAIVSGWGPSRHEVFTYDIKLDDPSTRGEIVDRCSKFGVWPCDTPQEALQDADLVLSTVTADQATEAARAASPFLKAGQVWLDLNSCAPSSKVKSAGLIEAAGGQYVDVAVMAPVYPKLNRVPLLVAGPHADEIAPRLAGLPMSPRVVPGDIGAASSIKMIRSIMVKGLEALTAECTLAAVAAGVQDEVFASLLKSHPGTDWPAQTFYNFERSMVHGARRAAEMEEVARTLQDLGLPSDMVTSTVKWQRKLAAADVPAPENARQINPETIAHALLPHIRSS
ncbi:NAD(P)-dependent oxidoreductase [Roseibium aggregatum]|uniref:NAD(P)-dependent oxidoreductase n=1 Tax=Roseibium aggregatum TaxID=187304 RepID=A0A939EEJ1_9HYPH|nr:DUF1932 domain-containing protein [Roseibium aggregatum]MBN9671508.1 NAD(P)-dependent oxidoreductase [Roseibium aggregatum]